MELHFKDLRTAGKIYTIMNFFLLLTSIILAFTYGYRILLCGIYASMGIDYMIFQYFTTEEFWREKLAPRMHVPSRNMFAVFLVVVIAALTMLTMHLAPLTTSMGLLSLGLMGEVLSCVLNEYGINGNKKDVGIVTCAMALICIILLNLIVFRII